MWVSDYRRPGTLVPATEARFLRARGGGSPMGKGLLAGTPGSDDDAFRREMGVEEPPMAWHEVVALTEREGLPGNARTH